MELLKTLFPVFWSPKDYAEVLKKLAAFLFWETYVLTFVLRTIPGLDKAFDSVENFGPIGKALSAIPYHQHLNLLGFVISLLVAWLSHAIQVHDRVSDLFGIRRRFDRNHILLPLAVLAGVQLSAAQLNRIDANRDSLMRKVFYRYASSRAEKPLVDKHDIERALDVWSWFWILIEATVLLLAGVLIAALYASYSLVNWLCWLAVCLWLLASLYSLRLPRFARPQVEAIAANPEARLAIKEEFCAL
jgi:hypothetical protein